jgi:hypothetical protein
MDLMGSRESIENVEGSEPPVIGKRYLFRDGVFVRAKPRENEVIYRFDGVNFRACGLG